MELTYRLAMENDIDNICEMVEEAVSTMIKNNIFQWDELYPVKEDFLTDIGNHELYMGLIDEEIAIIYVINAKCDPEYNDADWKYKKGEHRMIHRLCVNPKYQRMGVAERTLRHIENDLKRQGISAIRLDTFSGNPFALKLYAKMGYEIIGHVDWRKGRFLLMEKSLS